MNMIYIFLIAGLLISSIKSQFISADFWPSNYVQILHDHNIGWESNTMFKPFHWSVLADIVNNDFSDFPQLLWLYSDLLKETQVKTDKSLQTRIWLGIITNPIYGNEGPYSGFEFSPYAYFQLTQKEKLYLHLYPRLVSNPESQPHYTGIPRDIRRLGLNSGEVDISVIGYRNDWLTGEIGRGRQNWGGFFKDNLAISANSAPYDYGLIELRHKWLKARYFHGYLETVWDEGNYNRYITGRGLEYSNSQNLVMGVSEIIVYSGLNRPLDIGYFNPLLTHLEVELNKRTNRQDDEYAGSNSIWQISGDWLVNKRFRFSGNLLIDEFVLDEFQLKEGRKSSTAYQFRIAYSNIFNRIAFTLSGDYTRVGSYTFIHQDGYNNFVSRDFPLGTEIGSDGDKGVIGVSVVFPFRIISNMKFGYYRFGERTILNNPYNELDQFTEVSFPSGSVNNNHFFNWLIMYRLKRNLEIDVKFNYVDSDRSEDQKYVIVTINGYIPSRFPF